jgi:shikimate kinase
MCAGKTCVGELLARHLGWQFVDLDRRIVAGADRSVARIFEELGETEFRRRERRELARVLDELAAGQRAVVALGGGAFVQPASASLLAGVGAPIVFLDAPVEELWRRAQNEGGRPLATAENQFRQLYELRRGRYMEADLRVETSGRSVAQVATEIVAVLGLQSSEGGSL